MEYFDEAFGVLFFRLIAEKGKGKILQDKEHGILL